MRAQCAPVPSAHGVRLTFHPQSSLVPTRSQNGEGRNRTGETTTALAKPVAASLTIRQRGLPSAGQRRGYREERDLLH